MATRCLSGYRRLSWLVYGNAGGWPTVRRSAAPAAAAAAAAASTVAETFVVTAASAMIATQQLHIAVS